MSNPTSQEIARDESSTTPGAAEASGESNSGAGGEKAADPLMQLQADLERQKDRALRAQADLDNYRKRALREREDAVKYANMDLLERLIPILDNFELGLGAARNSPGGEAILSGMEMVGRQLADFLKQGGVDPIDATGQKFDPNLHEAVAHEASAEVPEGSIIRQMRRGFKLKDRLIRPATVVVSKGAE